MHAELIAANQAFYDAFSNADPVAMDALWARRAPVACVHPGWAPLFGREAVLRSFGAIMASGAPAITCASPRVQLLGEVAYVLCTEILGEGRLVATNVFVREDERWRLVHHHAGPVPEGRGDEDEDPESDDGESPPSSALN